MLPRALKPFKARGIASLVLTRLPFDWVETSENKPMLNTGLKLGLPGRFNFESNIQTTISSTLIRTGLRYNVEYKRLSACGGLDGAYLYFTQELYGFTNKVYGWSMYPNITFGYCNNNIAFTVVGELDFILSNTMTSEDVTINKNKRRLAGRSVGIYMEQKIHRNCILTLGLVNNFQKTHFTAWPGLSTFNRFYYIPQIYLGIVL